MTETVDRNNLTHFFFVSNPTDRKYEKYSTCLLPEFNLKFKYFKSLLEMCCFNAFLPEAPAERKVHQLVETNKGKPRQKHLHIILFFSLFQHFIKSSFMLFDQKSASSEHFNFLSAVTNTSLITSDCLCAA